MSVFPLDIENDYRYHEYKMKELSSQSCRLAKKIDQLVEQKGNIDRKVEKLDHYLKNDPKFTEWYDKLEAPSD